MKLSVKLMIFSLTIVVISSMSILFMIQSLTRSNEALQQFAKQDATFLSSTINVYALGLQRGQAVRNVMLNPTDQKAKDNFEKAVQDTQQTFEQLKTQAPAFGLEAQLAQIERDSTADIELQKEVVDFISTGKMKEAHNLLTDKETPQWRKVKDQYFTFEANVRKKLGEKADTMQQQGDRVVVASYVLLAVLLLIVIGLSYYQRKMFVDPLVRMQNYVTQIAEGNLKIEDLEIRSKDEIGELATSFNRMRENLGQLVTQLNRSSQQVAASSQELFESTERITNTTRGVAGTIEEVAAGAMRAASIGEEGARGVEEAARSIQVIAESVSNVAEFSYESKREADQGNQAIQKVIAQMDVISESVVISSELVQNLGERSQKIGTFIDLITQISNQTNLLALNAAIEAARAGEHGKGFAVVADEVKNLAEESKQSAEQIVVLIAEIQNDIQQVIERMAREVKEVETGRVLSDRAGESFAVILQDIGQVAEQIQEVSAASEELSAGSEQVATSVEQMSHMSKEAASHSQGIVEHLAEELALMETFTHSADSLRKLAQDLEGVIRKFSV